MSIATFTDELKALSAICEPDTRQAYLSTSLAGSHAELAAIQLRPTVPVEIRRLFETAKNVSLYSWFVYPFHQVAEMTSFSALEYALRIRAKVPKDMKRPPGLSELLQQAKTKGWFSKDWAIRRSMGVERARERRSKEAMDLMHRTGAAEVEVADPTEEEIAQATASVDVVQILVDRTPRLRNNLAHGSTRLDSSSTWTLRFVGEAINQLFP
ncbi:MAG TPA: hypothetical protein VM240_05445 [Verrucomicrobiae bacterium]|nr:hypothetical protein [Verrucomicrobiae bacterium]